MSAENKKQNCISKETRDAIKKFLTSNVSLSDIPPISPELGLDQNFSRILMKKREEQLEASRQKAFESGTSKIFDSTIEHNGTNIGKSSVIAKNKTVSFDLENSMLFSTGNKSLNVSSCSDDSFLALERQCNLEDKKEQIINANDTLLFDVEPPAELWNQTVNQTSMIPNFEESTDEIDQNASIITSEKNESNESNESIDESDEETIEISPTKYIGLIRPSTIIEETSSQMESSSQNSSTVSKNSSNNSSESFKLINNSANDSKSNLFNRPCFKKARRQSRRETFAFKRRNYTFFPEENLNPIDESTLSIGNDSSLLENSENKKPDDNLMGSDPDTSETEKDQFNDTLEAMDYFLEKGRKQIEKTPATKRDNLQRSILETPLFSCKRKRLLDEISISEAMPLPKRGPLIDFSTPEILHQPRTSRFTEKR